MQPNQEILDINFEATHLLYVQRARIRLTKKLKKKRKNNNFLIKSGNKKTTILFLLIVFTTLVESIEI